MGFLAMDDKVFLPSRDYDDGLLKPASPEESDWDSDASDEERDPQSQLYHKAGNIYSAYTRLVETPILSLPFLRLTDSFLIRTASILT